MRSSALTFGRRVNSMICVTEPGELGVAQRASARLAEDTGAVLARPLGLPLTVLGIAYGGAMLINIA
jgi:hypothetical protein